MSGKNTGLLKATLAMIKANPSLHYQGDWVEPAEDESEYNPCATRMCFAGHAAILAGATFDKDIWYDEYEWYVDPETGNHVAWDSEDDDRTFISTFAANKLGLDSFEREYLFSPSRTMREIEAFVNSASNKS